ncbi:hypothetical protein EMMF5_001709 [Cystobasidiomycetes sp. EMM_F5]
MLSFAKRGAYVVSLYFSADFYAAANREPVRYVRGERRSKRISTHVIYGGIAIALILILTFAVSGHGMFDTNSPSSPTVSTVPANGPAAELLLATPDDDDSFETTLDNVETTSSSQAAMPVATPGADDEKVEEQIPEQGNEQDEDEDIANSNYKGLKVVDQDDDKVVDQDDDKTVNDDDDQGDHEKSGDVEEEQQLIADVKAKYERYRL